MVTIAAYLIVATVIALFVGISIRPRATGWFIAGAGVLFLIHAGVTLAIIWAHDNVVPPYVNYWGLFATIPTGLILVIAGVGIICVQCCVLRMNKPPK
jgi:hypothetical protein